MDHLIRFCTLDFKGAYMDTKKKNIIVCIIATVFIATGFILSVIKPDNDYSAAERRKLQKKPDVSATTIMNGKFMNDFENYSMDQFPFRESFRKIKSFIITDVFNMKDKNGLYEYKGYISDMDYPLNEKSYIYATDRFKYIKDKYLDKSNSVYISVIPDKNIYLGEKSGHLSVDLNDVEKIIKEQMPYAEYISISDLLNENDYYKTDTHFKQECVLPAAMKIAKDMGAEVDNNFETVNLKDDFYGVYYGQYAKDVLPDMISYLTNDTIENMDVYDGENKKEIPVYNTDKLKGKDPYELFLSGPLSLVTINNTKVENDRRLIIFRDSFGSSIAPVIATAYKETILVDIRYIHPAYLDKFISFENADILFLYSTLVLNNSESIK